MLILVLLASGILAAQKQYKRVHQYALRRIINGNAKRVEKDLRAHAAEHPADPETWFMLACAASAAGRKAEGTAYLERAHDLGLPAGRFLAGPRKLLALYDDTTLIRRLHTEFRHRPVHGPLVGAVSIADARIWLRTSGERNVAAVCTTAASATPITAKGRTSARDDFTSVLHLRGLRPSTTYSGRLVIDGQTVSGDEGAFRFTTPPPRGPHDPVRLGFGGGAGYVPQHERMWSTIQGGRFDLLLLLGDNIYIDHPKRPIVQRYTYHRRQSRPEWRALTRAIPTFTIWDDHDFGTNDCWVGPDLDQPAWKVPVFNVFRQNWANPGYGDVPPRPGLPFALTLPTKTRPGCWYTFAWGAIDFFMLDGRMYREKPNEESTTSMLGPRQKAWLFNALAASTATFKVICSPVPFEYRTKGNSKDTWNGFRAERTEVFDFLTKRKIEGVVLLSADRHRSDAWVIARPGDYALHEFNSSRLTNQHVHQTKKDAIFSYNAKQSFGSVTLDPRPGNPTVVYDVIDIDGVRQHRLVLPGSKLKR